MLEIFAIVTYVGVSPLSFRASSDSGNIFIIAVSAMDLRMTGSPSSNVHPATLCRGKFPCEKALRNSSGAAYSAMNRKGRGQSLRDARVKSGEKLVMVCPGYNC